MADKVTEARMRSEITKMLDGADLEALKVGHLRNDLEKRLNLPSGSLDSRKDEVKMLIQEELVRELTRRNDTNDDEPAKKKQKKDKKDKKNKKDKKSSDEGEAKEETPAPTAVATKDESADKENIAVQEKADAVATTVEDPQKDVAVAQAADVTEMIASPQKGALVSRTRSWALTGSEDGSLKLWDLESKSCIRAFEGHVGTVRDIEADWTDMQAISAAEDGARLWDLNHGGCQKSFPAVAANVGEESGCTAIRANWKEMTGVGGCADGSLRHWDLTSGDVVKKTMAHPGGVWALEAKWEEKRVVSGGDEQLKVWDLKDFSCIAKIDAGQPGGIMSISMDWEMNRALVGTGEQNLNLWNIEARKSHKLIAHRDAVAHVCADWDDNIAVTGGWDASLRVWDLTGCVVKQTFDVDFGRVRALTVDFAKMQAVCGSSSGALHMVDVKNGAVLRTIDGHIGAVTSLQAHF